MAKKSSRFDIVLANSNRIEVFWESFGKVKNFNPTKDRIVVMDCSKNPNSEILKSQRFIKRYNLQLGKSIIFIIRRNWNLNHGAQLDYIRALSGSLINTPKFAYFIQDHYLNTSKFVKEDTIPKGETLNLDLIEKKLLENKKTVWFCSRGGFKISARFKNINDFYNNKVDSRFGNLQLLSFVVDGGNFCVDPQVYIDIYRKDRSRFVRGIGGTGPSFFCHVWETRLCKYLYDRGFVFYEQKRNISFSTIENLLHLYPKRGKVWDFFFNSPIAYYLHGRDFYISKFDIRFLWFVLTEFRISLIYDHNTKLTLLG